MSQIQVTLPDNSVRTYNPGVTIFDVALSIGKKLAEDALAGTVDGVQKDLNFVISKNAKVSIITRNSKDGLEILRHSSAHLLAHALEELYPGTQITIGPVIDEGFFYDIDCPKKLTPDDLPVIEKKMAEIIEKKLPVKRVEFTKQQALDFFKKRNEPYKLEIISLSKDDIISAYWHGEEFVDLCRGPHIPNTFKAGKFKLTSIAGAYWRGDEKNKMLQRIYGTAYNTQKELDEHLNRIEEARKRDHRKLGPELGLFQFLPAAPAMPFYLAKGSTLYNLLTNFMKKEVTNAGYQEVICPQVMTANLWRTSGHWDHYRENMFVIQDNDGGEFALKPMNCPGHATLFGSTRHSYRELPIRMAEFSKLHRNERAGVTHGLLRTRAFCQDDAHIFCTEEQILEEASNCIKHTYEIYKKFGFTEIKVRLATRPDEYIGTPEIWVKAEKTLEESLTKNNITFEMAPKEGAFYGPKIEFHIKDSIGREWQCGTVQLDYSFPQRFSLEYYDHNDKPQKPVMIHRAILGSFERFIGILIEHHNGHLPLWVAPVQATVINLTDAQKDYAQEVANFLKTINVRCETDFRNQQLNYKIREAQMQKIPLMIIVGAKEQEAKKLTVRKSSGENLPAMTFEEFKAFYNTQTGGNDH
jgi:threonyl-tRNA synthetase